MPTITTKHWRGTYVARIEVNDRGTIDRYFQEIAKVERLTNGSRIRRYRVDAGWYESREGYRMYQGQPNPKTYWRVTDTTVEKITFDELAVAIEGPAPNEDGTWGSNRCRCGAEVEGFTVDGFPYCNAHAPVTPEPVDEEVSPCPA